MDLKRALGLALCAAALALAGWGLFAAWRSARTPPVQPIYVEPPPWVEVYLYHDGALRVGDKIAGGEIVRETFLIVLAGVVLGLALAFGLGGQRKAAELLERWWPSHGRRNDKGPQ